MTPIGWAIRPMKSYAVFKGRAPRPEFWWFFAAYFTVSISARLADTAIGSRVVGTYGVFASIANFSLLLPFLAVAARRLHDTDRTGWWILVAFVPQFANGWRIGSAVRHGLNPAAGTSATILGAMAIVGTIALLILLAIAGTRGANRYGPDPDGPSDLEEVFA